VDWRTLHRSDARALVGRKNDAPPPRRARSRRRDRFTGRQRHRRQRIRAITTSRGVLSNGAPALLRSETPRVRSLADRRETMRVGARESWRIRESAARCQSTRPPSAVTRVVASGSTAAAHRVPLPTARLGLRPRTDDSRGPAPGRCRRRVRVASSPHRTPPIVGDPIRTPNVPTPTILDRRSSAQTISRARSGLWLATMGTWSLRLNCVRRSMLPLWSQLAGSGRGLIRIPIDHHERRHPMLTFRFVDGRGVVAIGPWRRRCCVGVRSRWRR